MKDKEIHSLWKEFIITYKIYITNPNELWKNKLNLVKHYIDDNKKPPSRNDKNIDIKQLSIWIKIQKLNYNNDIKECKGIMKDVEIHTLWKQFINNITKK